MAVDDQVVLRAGAGAVDGGGADESEDTGVLFNRVDAPLFLANANRVHHRIPRYVVLDTGAVFHVDATAAQALARLTAIPARHHRELVLARPREAVLAALHADPSEGGATRGPVYHERTG
ncbi:sodium-independent anion transporter [Streptomyces sp. NPDC048514]|uniref:sodium-independent anion transporter n=1 Tax=Streptomyces sp. NPDC048514 TaxID=3365564 RepID=UPI0037138581